MNNWLDILVMIPILALLLLAYRYIVLKRQAIGMAKKLLQGQADNDLLKRQILQTIEDKKLIESEEFMSFLSNSREAAFSYIEEAQAAILNFNVAILDAQVEGTDSNDILKRILDANKELQKLLPDNIKK